MKNMFELRLKHQAEKLREKNKIKKAIAVVRDGVKKQPSVDLYTYLGVLYFYDGQLLQASHSFAKALDHYEGEQSPTLLFNFLKNEVIEAGADSLYLAYELAMYSDIDNQLRYKLYRFIIGEMFVGVSTKLNKTDLFQLHKKVLDCIPIQSWDKKEPKKNNDVMILCGQFIGLGHGPTLTTIAMAKHVREMGGNPIILCLNSLEFDEKYKKGGFVPNKIENYRYHRNFNLDSNTISQPEHQFSTVTYQDESYPFFFIEMSFNERCAQIPHIFSDAINNENIIIAVGSPDLFFDLLGRYTKVYMLPCHFGLPTSVTTYPIICRSLSEVEKITTDDALYQNGLVESRFPYHLKFEYEDVERSRSPGQLIFAIVGHRLEVEVNDIIIHRMAVISKHYPSVVFKFIGKINNPAAFIKKMTSGNVGEENILLFGNSDDMRLALNDAVFYLNPKRAGGGTSSLEALSLNIPVISYPHGDVYHTSGEKFAFEDDEQMLGFIDSYIDDVAFRQEVSEYCKQRFHLNTNFKQVIRDLTRGALL